MADPESTALSRLGGVPSIAPGRETDKDAGFISRQPTSLRVVLFAQEVVMDDNLNRRLKGAPATPHEPADSGTLSPLTGGGGSRRIELSDE